MGMFKLSGWLRSDVVEQALLGDSRSPWYGDPSAHCEWVDTHAGAGKSDCEAWVHDDYGSWFLCDVAVDLVVDPDTGEHGVLFHVLAGDLLDSFYDIKNTMIEARGNCHECAG